MRIVYDPSADAAYIYLRAIGPGEIARTEPCDVEIKGAAVILGFDAEEHLIGIEILGASRLLPAETLNEALRP